MKQSAQPSAKSPRTFTHRFTATLVAFLMSFAPMAVVGLAVGGLSVSSVAMAGPSLTNGSAPPAAQGDNAFNGVTTTVCAVANGLTGPLGVGIGFLVLVAGLIALQVASRDAMPMIARAAVGTTLILGSSTAFAALLARPCA